MGSSKNNWFCIAFVMVIIINSQSSANTIFVSTPKKDIELHMCLGNETLAVRVSVGYAFFKALYKCNVMPIKSVVKQATNGYVYSRGIGMHKLHTEATDWNNARKICMKEDAYLAVINSKAEENVLASMLKKKKHHLKNTLNKGAAFIGIHDAFEEGDWVTVFGTALKDTDYVGWSQNHDGRVQPDDGLGKYGGQNCGSVLIDGGMDDAQCSEKLAFFCEKAIPC